MEEEQARQSADGGISINTDIQARGDRRTHIGIPKSASRLRPAMEHT
jgi:hypothetical protein